MKMMGFVHVGGMIMKGLLFFSVAFLLHGIAAPLCAQEAYTRPVTGPATSPPLSPYLNLVRGGNAAVNYYGLVRPQMQTQQTIQQLQQQNTPAPASPGLTIDSYPNSGHSVQFMNFSHYFNNNIGSGLTGGRMGGPGNSRR